MNPIFKRLLWVLAAPFIGTAMLLYFITMIIGMITIDPFVWLFTGKSFFLAFGEGRLFNRGELFGPK